MPLDSEHVENPLAGEVIFVEGKTVLTRRWTWRQGKHTLVVPETTAVEFNVDGLPPVPVRTLSRLCREIMELIGKYCGGKRPICRPESREPDNQAVVSLRQDLIRKDSEYTSEMKRPEHTQPSDTAPPETEPAITRMFVSVDGLERRYAIHVPQAWDGRTSLPVVTVFHGGGGTAANMIRMTRWIDKADEAGFIAAFLEGMSLDPTRPGGFADNPQFWNDGNRPPARGRAQHQ